MTTRKKLMTGVAVIALALPALVLETTDAEARAVLGGGHAVSHASVARPATMRPSASHVTVAHAQLSHPLHTQLATRPLNMSQAHPNLLINRIGPNAPLPTGVTQPMHTTGNVTPGRMTSLAQPLRTQQNTL